ncbi:PEP-CTERM sorting domain-containing protein [Luteolibacter flavescens]|uniref:PEP-CTERM sorting domain-containing protein n=1 Tax=Luteolibacter flavescens TaxID=1859460 RepID=A0ABT3FMS7_9BACT|nr:PEP-CTERM sorting domain-containing protein [Luteolibacter flavescens]MCW1884876.1 PEP-CTERM sorting domain-containing protein [Luteolibacter flavescens]
MKCKALAAFASASIALAATQASAATVIELSNPGFETDAVGSGAGGSFVPAGWTSFASGGGNHFVGDGAWLAGDAVLGAHTGDQYYLAHVLNNGHRTIHQDTSLAWSSLVAGDVLTMSVWTTYRSNLAPGLVYMWLNDTDAPSASPNSGPIDIAADAAPGVWTQRVWNFTVTQGILDTASANSWGTVNLQLGMIGSTGDRQAIFDDVSMVLTPVPEPSTALLAGLMGVSFLIRRRR